MGCRMSKRTSRKGKSTKSSKDNSAVASVTQPEDMVTLLDLGEIKGMKRAQLQKLCKQFGLKASGKVRNQPWYVWMTQISCVSGMKGLVPAIWYHARLFYHCLM